MHGNRAIAPLISPHTDHWHLLVSDPLDPLEDTLSLCETALVGDGVDDDKTVPLEHVLRGGRGIKGEWSESVCVLCVYIYIYYFTIYI